jgi:hypothetical protein
MTTERYARMPSVAGSRQDARSPMATVPHQATIGGERYEVVVTTTTSGAPIRMMNVATGAALSRAARDREGRGGLYQEALAA